MTPSEASPTSPGHLRSPTNSQPFIYPMRSAVSVKRPDSGRSQQPSISPAFPQSGARSSSPTASSSTEEGPESPTVELRNRLEDFDLTSGQSSADSESSETNSVEDPMQGIERATTARFEHVETKDGHMILTGRAGKLTRCEDEVSTVIPPACPQTCAV